MTFTNDGLTIANIAVSSIKASELNSNLSSMTSLYSSTITSDCAYIPSNGTISFGNHTFSAEELGALLHYLQQLHPESQI